MAKKSRMNLLPDDYVRQRLQYRVDMICVLMFAVVMAAIMTAEAISSRRLDETRLVYHQVNARFSEAAKFMREFFDLQREKQQLLKEADVIVEMTDRLPRSFLLATITNACPDGMGLTRLQIQETHPDPPVVPVERSERAAAANDEEKKPKEEPPLPPPYVVMFIDGLAQSNENISTFMSRLRSNPMVENIELQFIRDITVEERDFRHFILNVKLKPNVDAIEVQSVQRDREDLSEIVPDVAVRRNDAASEEALR